jgi:23S rRNA (uracil1939-C5)-methyltransferase
VRLLEESDDRVAPSCPRYSECGGCQIQHLPYEKQLEWKGRIVADALRRIGGLGEVDPPEVVASPDEFGYRNRVTFTLRRLKRGYVVAGFHALGRPAHVIDVGGECLLPRPDLMKAWTKLRAVWGRNAELLPDAGRLRLTLRRSVQGVELVVHGGPEGWSPDPLTQAGASFSAVWHVAGDDEATPALLVGEATAGGGVAFEQVNPGAAELLRNYVLELCSGSEPGRAVDAYCGTGAYGRALAEAGWSVTGLELEPGAAEAAGAAAPEGFRVQKGRVEALLASALPADLLVVNPPRAGMHEDVPGIIAADPPARLVYVSCDPGTLARDLGRLADSYELGRLRSFDLFPQTAHVETVVELTERSES